MMRGSSTKTKAFVHLQSLYLTTYQKVTCWCQVPKTGRPTGWAVGGGGTRLQPHLGLLGISTHQQSRQGGWKVFPPTPHIASQTPAPSPGDPWVEKKVSRTPTTQSPCVGRTLDQVSKGSKNLDKFPRGKISSTWDHFSTSSFIANSQCRGWQIRAKGQIQPATCFWPFSYVILHL